ncbi:tannase/feruloyl esterase family alpha/beta hydrolase [Novosphingobium profundi]|uniref:tannase/feruloyl esterase family alpha/beta hydrolase n=1 Tax=Novosphingobium profundi TaxID=1774954 RepID=UPI001BDAE5E1|nr:tannase/feruloyl esterase family alpha/beta hydrolase [Novosphingobium profundi]MBT0669318.1 tannase/feruloyl esterase family alpha/beta hydrolase [Novosphingobium profundi]
MRIAHVGIAAFLLLGAAAPGRGPEDEAPEARCAAFAKASFGGDVRLTSVRHVGVTEAGTAQPGGSPLAVALPAHCRVEGVIGERTGAGGKPFGIGFAIALPDDWNGRFLLQGGGGLNGSVGFPAGPVAAGDRPALARGFAVISHDSGHKGAVFDQSFLVDQRATLDFAETSVLTVATLGKKITAAYYGKPIGHSYMTGCSTGGREGMLATQRYPELFDGVIIGAPAMRTGDSNLGQEYTQVLFNQAAPKGPDGTPIMSEVLNPADRKTIVEGILAQCDGLDGLKDGMIENVAQCHFQPAKLLCKGGRKTEGCLGAGQVKALELGLAGPRDKAGYPIYAPMSADTGIAATPIGYLPTGGPGPFGPPNSATSIDLDARIHAIRNTPWQRLTDTNYWTNLNTYLDRGGKIMFYHGVSDFWFSPLATWDYYQRAEKDNGKAFTQASRFYMVPGMLHCGGGNSFERFDMLSKMVDWVEKGEAPQEIIAQRRAPSSETRPLCPYPAHAQYRGGEAGNAASFTCTPPSEAGPNT